MKSLECKHIRTVLVDFIDKNLDEMTTEGVKDHLKSCKSCQLELEQTLVLITDLNTIADRKPPGSIKEKFLSELNQEKAKLESQGSIKMHASKKQIWLYNPMSQLAAGLAILITGLFLGFLMNNRPQDTVEVAQLKNEVLDMKQMLFHAKLDQASASQRIMAVNYTQDFNEADKQVMEALVHTMNNDDNINVRMASMHALSKFSNESYVREALVQSLRLQEDALLQITLINILVEIQEEDAIQVMRELLDKEETIEAVKQMAEKGITTFI